MTGFVVERTGEYARAQLRWNANGRAGEFIIYASARQTETGDILRHPESGEQFLLGDHDLNGLLLRGKQQYRVGFFTVSDTLNVWRQGALVADNLPAVVSASVPWGEALPSQSITGQKLRIATQPVDVRKGDDVWLGRTGNHLQIEKIDTESWQGKLVLVYGTIWR